MVVTPPTAALRVSVSTLTSNGSWKVCRCTCGSMIPGRTCSPSASITRSPDSVPGVPMAAIVPPDAATSARTTPSGKTTSPPLIAKSKSLKDPLLLCWGTCGADGSGGARADLVQCLAEPVGELAELLGGDHQRRRDVQGAGRQRAGQHASASGGGDRAERQAGVPGDPGRVDLHRRE